MGIIIPKNREISESKYYLLMIGIDDYLYLPPLYNCVRDVKSIAEVLTTRFQFNSEDIFLLLNDNASKKNIYKQFLDLIDLLQENDSIMVYYAGHGFYNQKLNEGYMIPFDGNYQHLDTCLEMSIVSKFINSFKAKHVLFITDSDLSLNFFNHGNRI